MRGRLISSLLALIVTAAAVAADGPISGLTAQTDPLATGDLTVCVDVSDTTDAGTGTTKKCTIAQVSSAVMSSIPSNASYAVAMNIQDCQSSLGAAVTNSNLTLTGVGGTKTCRANAWKQYGKLYAEFTFTSGTASGVSVGVTNGATDPASANAGIGVSSTDFGFELDGFKTNSNSNSAYGSSFSAGDVGMMAVDLVNRKIWWGKNGTWFNSGDPAAGTNAAFTTLASGAAYAPSAAVTSVSDVLTWNFGRTAFAYTPPTGFSPWDLDEVVGLGSNAIASATTYPALSLYASGKTELVTNGSLTYNASTGRLSATSFGGSGAGLTGVPISTGVSGLGTSVATALGTNVGSAGAFVTFNGAGGTPSAITLTNGTGLPAAGVVGTAAILGANTFTRGQTITEVTANESIIASTGGSNTGSNAASMLDYSWTLNTSGSPDVVAYRITDTARGASTKLFNIYAGASGTTSEFSVDRGGNVVANTSVKIGTAGSKTAPEILLGNQTGTGFFYRSSDNIGVALGSKEYIEFNGSGLFNLSSDMVFGWTSTAASGSGAANFQDTGLSRDIAGVVQFNGGTASTTKGGWKVIADTNGSYSQQSSSTEALTLATGATTTATSGNLAAANSQIEAILVRVTTTITTAANYGVKVTGGNAFCKIGTASTTSTNITATNTDVWVPCAHADQYNASATTLTVTTNVNPGAGALRITPVYKVFSAPSS